MPVLLLAGGFVALVLGGEAVVRGAVSLAGRWGLPPLLVGVVVVGFATSLPELVVSMSAAFKDQASIALANVAGSNIANLLLILGVAAVIRPLEPAPEDVKRDALAMTGAMGLLVVIALTGSFSRPEGLALVLLLACYLWWSYRTDVRERLGKERREAPGVVTESFGKAPRAVATLLIGLGALVVGAQLAVAGAVGLARTFGVSEVVIGLTVVALGTSLPELATSVVGTWRGHGEVVVGNAIGSNIFNALGIVGVTALLAPMEVAPVLARVDLPAGLLAAVLLLPLLLLSNVRLGRAFGVVMLALYAGFVVARYTIAL